MNDKILVVDDEESIRFTFSAFLSDAGYQVETAASQSEALEMIEQKTFDVIFLDILLGRESGMNVLQVSREVNPNIPVIMVTGAPEIKTAAETVRLGAFDYITKPVHQDELLHQAKMAVEHKILLDRQETYRLRMSAVFQSIREGLLIFDDEMKLVEINPAAVNLLGCRREQLGQTAEALGESCPPLKMLQDVVEYRCEGEIFRQEIIGKDGQPLTVGLTMAPLSGHAGREFGTVLVIRDETQTTRQA